MGKGGNRHTIILVQYDKSYNSRSFMDFQAVGMALDAVVKMYETKLKELNPGVPNIEYDIARLYGYLDELHDICALVLDPSTNKYEPHDKQWIKQKIYDQLRNSAAK